MARHAGNLGAAPSRVYWQRFDVFVIGCTPSTALPRLHFIDRSFVDCRVFERTCSTVGRAGDYRAADFIAARSRSDASTEAMATAAGRV